MGTTALHCTALNRRVETAKVLLEKGAFIEAINVFGSTPLHCAIRRRDVPSMSEEEDIEKIVAPVA